MIKSELYDRSEGGDWRGAEVDEGELGDENTLVSDLASLLVKGTLDLS